MKSSIFFLISVLVTFTFGCDELDRTIRTAPEIIEPSEGSDLLANGEDFRIFEVDLSKNLGLNNQVLITTTNGGLIKVGGSDLNSTHDSIYLSGTERKLPFILVSSRTPDDHVLLTALIGTKQTTSLITFSSANAEEIFIHRDFDSLRLSDNQPRNLDIVLYRKTGRVSFGSRVNISSTPEGLISHPRVLFSEADTFSISLSPLISSLSIPTEVVITLNSEGSVNSSSSVFITN